MKIQLLTGDGRRVCRSFHIPPFITAPDVIQWGERTFIKAGESDEGEDWDHSYVEAFAYFVLTGPDGLPYDMAPNGTKEGE